MSVILIENVFILICTALGYAGGFRYIRNQGNLYATIIVSGLGCMNLGRLYQCMLLWTGGSLTDRFQVGVLAIAGAFSFFFSANYAQIDSLVDDKSPMFMKYRLIGGIGPLIVVILTLVIPRANPHPSFLVGCVIVAAIVSAASYFHVKHLFIPDVERGVVRCLRPFNALALALSVLSMSELIALAWNREGLLIASGIGLGLVTLALVPVMDRGVEQWTT